jgi:hypoxanthine phosphoribosyltransferase
MPNLIPVLTKKEIDKAVSEIARSISSDYKDCDLILICVLKGAFIFLSDLIRQLSIPVKVDFAGLSSYGTQTSTSGSIHLTKDIEIDLKDTDVLIIEDIIDTGLSLTYLVDHIKKSNPKSVKICALIDKRERRKADISIDYVGHIIEKGFLVGYGLDYAEKFRNLPEVYHLKT